MEEAHFVFTSDPIEIKSEGKDIFVEGYISTSDLDLVNDIVTKACLMDMADQMRQRVIKFDVEHEAFRGKSNIEREINKTKIPVAKVEDFLMDKKGIKVRAKLNPHASRFDEVKGSIEDGFLDAFSIAYVPMKATHVTKKGQKVRMLDKLNLLNVAFTGNPVNTEARMVNVFTKSLELLKDTEEEKKANVLYTILDKWNTGKKLDSKETTLLNSAAKVAISNSTEKQLFNEIMQKETITYRDYNIVSYLLDLSLDQAVQEAPMSKSHSQSNDIIKLQEAKKMSEENEKVDPEAESEIATEEKSDVENKDEETETEEEESEEDTEVKSLKAEVKSLNEKIEAQNKEIAEVKALLKKPVRKSTVEQKDKSDNFVEEKSLNPLDMIA